MEAGWLDEVLASFPGYKRWVHGGPGISAVLVWDYIIRFKKMKNESLLAYS